MLLELARRGEEPLRALLQLGVAYLEDCAAEHVIQHGGWGTVFNLEPEEEEYPGLIAEDSNDIYILPSDNSGQVSPPESPTVTASWQCESLPASLSASQSWHAESLPVSLGPESWQQIAMDPEEVKSLDSNGAGEKSENNSSNSDIVHVEKEEIPEGVEEAAGAMPSQDTQAALPAPDPLQLHTTAPLEPREPPSQVAALEKASPIPSLFVELCEEEVEAATGEPAGMERKSPPALLSEKQGPGGEAEATPASEGRAALLLGGAAAVAVLAVAFGVALALKKK
ncbi:bcl-2-like protein 13 isoform X2 [Perognathus longimembris pacificus]|uniref:bcl-2-like protein 13 isoform X2 n=1 Tax=Perognathus longimembris pacificus TaxID=214514 RepID=UPI0020187861|nr:bcl-2-like protein 13 isoform X2 [Perognathus longimembris pacificus]